ncbi:PAS domain S-box protein [Halomonas sp. PR-M31]|uniref:PAS domain S-box protein n=1 Tax=Halomonas sp. PR-M31 TaxID=1471202 RepID=UPI00069FB255|nr:PAS domain S-box protein [Halomonas sp. PR-M31]
MTQVLEQMVDDTEGESERLATLHEYGILDTEAEESFDAITRLAALICGVPIALISLVDGKRQWFKSQVGLKVRETPRDQAFCAHTIEGDSLMEVADAHCDSRFRDNPLVLGEPHIRFYAGAPLTVANGCRLGTLCVIDHTPRRLDDRQRQALKELASLATKLLETHAEKRIAQANHAMLNSLLEALPEGVVASNTGGELSLFNRQARAWHTSDPSYSMPDEWTGQFNLYEADGETPLAEERIPLKRAWNGEWVRNQEICIKTIDQAPRHVLCNGQVFHSPKGVRAGAVVAMHDITEKRKVERTLLEARRRLELILQGTQAGTWEWNVQTGVTCFNDRWAEIVGYSLEELEPTTVETWISLAHPEDLAMSMLMCRRHLSGELPAYDIQYRMKHKNGEWVWVHDRGRLVEWDVNGKPLAMAGTHMDITARKQAEQESAEVRTHLQAVIDASTEVAIIATDLEGTITLFNSGAEGLLDYFAEEVVGRFTALDFHHEDEIDQRAAELSRTFGEPIKGFAALTANPSRGFNESRDWTYVCRDGSHCQVRLVVSAIHDVVGNVTGYLGVAIDRSQLQSMEEALQISESQFRGAFENTQQGMALVSLQGEFLEVNGALCDMLNYARDELLITTFQTLTHPDDLVQDLDALQKLISGAITHYQLEKRYITKAGDILWGFLSVVLVSDSAGKPQYFVAQIQDITEQRKLEQLKREFVAVVSHELRTPLTSIKGALDLINAGAVGVAPPAMIEMLTLAQRNAERLGQLVNDLLDWEKLDADKMIFDMRRHELHPLLEEAVAINLGYAAQYGVRLELVGERQACIEIDSLRFGQVMSNLLSNAIKFSPRGGLVQVCYRVENDHVWIDVIDQGPGIPSEFHPKVFQHFAQAKADDTRHQGGTGLGLAISKQFIEQMNGSIGFRSVIDQGTTFWLLLPVVTNDPAAQAMSNQDERN